MKNIKKLYIGLGIVLALLGTSNIAFAVQITVPSAPGLGYALVSTSTGNYIATTTDPFHVGSIYATSTSATSTFSNGINLTKGCFSVNATCIGTGAGSGTVTSITAGSGLTGGVITNSGTIALDVTNANTWSGLQSFTNTATTTFTGPITVGTSQFVVQQNSGNVGIATTSPFAPLSVVGNAYINGTLNIEAEKAYKYNNQNVIIASTSRSNYFFGGAGNFTATGTNNFGFGYLALASLTQGASNVAVGTDSLVFLTTNSNNTAVGYFTLAQTTGSGNTSLGYNSGNTLTGGTNNTFLGKSTDVTGGIASTVTNSTAIGNSAVITASNQVVLGNTSVTQTLLQGNVGISTTTPNAQLSILVAQASTTPAFYIGSTTAATTASTTFFKISSDSYVSGGNNQAFCQVMITSGSQAIANSFTKVTGFTVVTDNGANWNSGSQWYVVPKSGTYEVVSKVRYADNATANVSYGQGINTSLADNSDFNWFTSANDSGSSVSRNGSVNVRISHFNKGDTLLLETYWDAGGATATVLSASISFNMISAD